MTKLAQLIATEEGFYIDGSIPRRRKNPGDLRHAPAEEHPSDAPDSVGSFDKLPKGWAMLERQLQLYADRGMTLQQAIYEFAPPSENDSAAYLSYICTGLGCASTILVKDALLIT